MGIYDRDYYRGATRGSNLLSGEASVVKRLIAASVIVFLLQVFVTRIDLPVVEGFDRLPEAQQAELRAAYGRPVQVITEWFSLNARDVVERGQVWRLLTYAFLHGSPWHLLFNMIGLWIFGRGLEILYGSREFLLFYLTGAVFAGLCDIGLSYGLREFHVTIGASGAVMAAAMLYALYYPTDRIFVFFFPIEVRWLVTLYVVFDLYSILQQAGGGVTDGIAHAAHLGGLLYGYVYKRYDLRFGHWFESGKFSRWWRQTQTRRHVRVYAPEEDSTSLEEQVDAILAKISSQGEASLSDREREILKEASRRYKNR